MKGKAKSDEIEGVSQEIPAKADETIGATSHLLSLDQYLNAHRSDVHLYSRAYLKGQLKGVQALTKEQWDELMIDMEGK